MPAASDAWLGSLGLDTDGSAESTVADLSALAVALYGPDVAADLAGDLDDLASAITALRRRS